MEKEKHAFSFKSFKKKKVQQHTRKVRDKIAASNNREAEKEGDRGVGGEFLQETEK